MRILNSHSIYAWLGVLLVIAGLVHSGTLKAGVTSAALLELPIFVGFGVAHTLRRRQTPSSHLICAPLVTASALLWAVGHFGAAFVHAATTEVTNISEYPSYRKQGLKPQLISHFPVSIPANAHNVSFYYLPGFLQGAAIMQLRFIAPEAFVNEAFANAKRIGTNIMSGTDAGPHPQLCAGESKPRALPDRFQQFMFNAPQKPEDWNHPDRYGIAFDPAEREMLYWAEDW